jgi:hypothetical protein
MWEAARISILKHQTGISKEEPQEQIKKNHKNKLKRTTKFSKKRTKKVKKN